MQIYYREFGQFRGHSHFEDVTGLKGDHPVGRDNDLFASMGIMAHPRELEPVCPNALWRDKNERPLCNRVINMLCVSKDDQVPFFISLHGTQLKPVWAFLSALGLRKKSLYEFQATLSLKEKSNGKGKFFVIQFAELKENTPEEKEVFRAMFFQFAGHTIDQTFDAEKKMKDDLSDVPLA